MAKKEVLCRFVPGHSGGAVPESHRSSLFVGCFLAAATRATQPTTNTPIIFNARRLPQPVVDVKRLLGFAEMTQ